MNYVDGCVIPVPTANREAYRAFALKMAAVFKAHGALQVTECWGTDVPDGKLTSFPLAVQRAADESVVFSWIVWPSKAVRDAGMRQAMSDPAMPQGADSMPFDGKRMIFGGFEMILQV